MVQTYEPPQCHNPVDHYLNLEHCDSFTCHIIPEIFACLNSDGTIVQCLHTSHLTLAVKCTAGKTETAASHIARKHFNVTESKEVAEHTKHWTKMQQLTNNKLS